MNYSRWDHIDDSSSSEDDDDEVSIGAWIRSKSRPARRQNSWGDLLDNATIRRKHMDLLLTLQDTRLHVKTAGFDAVSSGFVSTAPVTSLAKVDSITTLRHGVINRGTILWCKVAAPVMRIVGVLALVEDGSGQLFQIGMYNFVDSQASALDCQRLLPEGTLLGVKEPYVKTFASGFMGLRTDHPSNIVVKRPNEQMHATVPPTAASSIEGLKAQGNAHFQAGDIIAAESCYSAALKQTTEAASPDMTVALLNNRAMCSLKRCAFVEALEDATKALSLVPTNAKSLFRRALALTGLRRHEESHAILMLLPRSKDVMTWRDVVARRVAESIHGHFKPIDVMGGTIVEDYIGPVEVKMTRGKGRGLFLTQPVRRGDLLLVEKAYATSLAILNEKKEVVIPTIDWSTMRGYSREKESLAEAVLKKSQERRIDLARLCCLYDGVAPNTTIPPMSLFRTDELLPWIPCEPRNLTQIRGILSTNSFQAPKAHDHEGVALYLVSSFMNHASTPNTEAQGFGVMKNLRVFVASKELDAGDELTTKYAADHKLKMWGIASPSA
ncbi:hypothetical protein DYB31_007215 [Aphanomyces astaci]|uniref:SET domain-containing protein n=1 Tax=Aphanomyces astaci TaxID=112090 RepID=A0A397FV69_APHAT|nr:hypothetical protein DYB31_007215 [Aphanomyces astaci]